MYRVVAIIILAIQVSLSCMSQENIWKGIAGKKRVYLTPYIVPGKENMAVIVCPGGSYFWLDYETEGHEVAKWLQSEGISAFVLEYRTALVPAFIFHHRLLFRGNRYPDPQNDLRQALRYIRANSEKFVIDTERIGMMGFSAGGHLVMSAVELFDRADWPSFVVPVYPVVTMTEPCVHERSRRGLLGEAEIGDTSRCDKLSLERHVPEDCPPVFLVNCKDDPIVDYRNSVLLDSALTAAKVPHCYLQYETGGHGFGASAVKGSEECRQWKEKFIQWLGEQYGKFR